MASASLSRRRQSWGARQRRSPGARSAPPGTRAGQREGASRVSLLWAHPSCGPTKCQSPAGHEQCGRGPPPRPLGEDGSGLCSAGPEGVRPYAPHRVASQSGFLEVPQEEREGPRPPRLRRPVSLQGGFQQPPEGPRSTPTPRTHSTDIVPPHNPHTSHTCTHTSQTAPHSHATLHTQCADIHTCTHTGAHVPQTPTFSYTRSTRATCKHTAHTHTSHKHLRPLHACATPRLT